MIKTMHRREQEETKEVISKENSEPASSPNPPKAYIPACGTLCDAFWWARRGIDREQPSD
jgi:hypothetical protein